MVVEDQNDTRKDSLGMHLGMNTFLTAAGTVILTQG
jgi:hypothetical protein